MGRRQRNARAEDRKKKNSNGEAARWRRRKQGELKWRSAKVKNRRFPLPLDL
jgi:hypothetical protein